jgi:hypothetical protein
MIKKFSTKIVFMMFENRISRLIRFLLKWNILAVHEGLTTSRLKNQPIDREGNPLPWLALPAIEFLERCDFKRFTICELGSGSSTLWWAPRCKAIFTFEHSQTWLNKLNERNAYSNIHGYIQPEYGIFENFEKFNADVIVIDGLDRTSACTDIHQQITNGKVSPVMIIFDNANWYPKSSDLLAQLQDFISIDFIGFPPMGLGKQTTRIFINTKRDSAWVNAVRVSINRDKRGRTIDEYTLE